MAVMLPWITEGEEYNRFLFAHIQDLGQEELLIDRETRFESLRPEKEGDEKKSWIVRTNLIFRGGKRVITGVGILAIPDPVPLVDEIYAVALIGAGTHDIVRGVTG